MKDIKLTEKQKRFADYFLATGNYEKSALQAGYSRASARCSAKYLAQNEKVKSYISEKLKNLDDNRIARISEVMEHLTRVMRGESVSEVVLVISTGEGMTEPIRFEKKPDEKERLKAAELLMRRYDLEHKSQDGQNLDTPIVLKGGYELED